MSGAQFLKVVSTNIYQLCRYITHDLEVNKLRAANKKYIFGIRQFNSFVLQLFICAEANAINKARRTGLFTNTDLCFGCLSILTAFSFAVTCRKHCRAVYSSQVLYAIYLFKYILCGVSHAFLCLSMARMIV